MTTRDRLMNWGLVYQDRCGPPGYPSKSAGFISTQLPGDDGYGDEGAPQEIPDPVDEKDADIVDKLILSIKDERLQSALIIEFARQPKVFKNKNYGYVDTVAAAVALMDDLLAGVGKKAQIFHLRQQGFTQERIATEVECSQQYVSQVLSMAA